MLRAQAATAFQPSSAAPSATTRATLLPTLCHLQCQRQAAGCMTCGHLESCDDIPAAKVSRTEARHQHALLSQQQQRGHCHCKVRERIAAKHCQHKRVRNVAAEKFWRAGQKSVELDAAAHVAHCSPHAGRPRSLGAVEAVLQEVTHRQKLLLAGLVPCRQGRPAWGA